MYTITILPNGSVKLSLPFNDVYIGKIANDTYIKKIKSSLHTFNKTNSIGFNYELMEQGQFRFVKVLSDDGNIYETTRNYVLHFGKVQTFVKGGFEKQIFLPIDEFGLDRALQYERTLTSQLSLFERASGWN